MLRSYGDEEVKVGEGRREGAGHLALSLVTAQYPSVMPGDFLPTLTRCAHCAHFCMACAFIQTVPRCRYYFYLKNIMYVLI